LAGYVKVSHSVEIRATQVTQQPVEG